MPKLYTPSATQTLITQLAENYNYECVQIWEGTLGIGNWVCIPPTENQYYFVVKEVYVNEWSSAQTIRRQRKIGRELMTLVEKAREAD